MLLSHTPSPSKMQGPSERLKMLGPSEGVAVGSKVTRSKPKQVEVTHKTGFGLLLVTLLLVATPWKEEVCGATRSILIFLGLVYFVSLGGSFKTHIGPTPNGLICLAWRELQDTHWT